MYIQWCTRIYLYSWVEWVTKRVNYFAQRYNSEMQLSLHPWCLNSDPSLLTKIQAYWWRSKPPDNWATALPQVLNLYIEQIHAYDTIVTYTSNKSQFGMIQVKPIHFKRIAVIKLTGSKASLSPNSNEEPDKSNTSAPISEKQPMRKILHYCSTIKEDKLSELS